MKKVPDMAGSPLFIMLPSKRVLVYLYAHTVPAKTPWGKEVRKIQYKGTDSTDKKNTSLFTTVSTYGGKLAENVTQAASRDIMAEALLGMQDTEPDWRYVGSVHDELIMDVPKDVDKRRVEEVMCVLPKWAAGFPIAAEADEGPRYRK